MKNNIIIILLLIQFLLSVYSIYQSNQTYAKITNMLSGGFEAVIIEK